MRKSWKRSLALSLGLLAGGARAGEPVPAAQLDRTVIATAGPRQAAATLDRPVPLSSVVPADQPAVVDPSFRPTAFTPDSDAPALVIRGQAPDQVGPKPMPTGPADPTTATPPPSTVWRRNPGTTQASGAPIETLPTAAAGATVVATAGPAVVTPADASATTPPPAIAGPAWSILHGNWADCGGTCSADDCDTCGCTFGNRFYVNADYLLWWIKGSKTPPLVTQGSAGDPIPGALGLPGTTVLFGGGSVENNPFSGARLSAGYWFGDQHLLGVDFGGFFLGQQGENFSASSPGTPILARPFIDAASGTETVEVVAAPGVLAGTVSVATRSSMWGYEGNLRSNFFAGQVCGIDYFVDGILGFRGLGLDESLGVNESLVVVGGNSVTAPSAGEQFAVADRFAVQNRFYGAQTGFMSEFRWNRWVLDVNTKIALGPTQEMVDISGSTVRTPLGGIPVVSNGGLLALPSNIGHYTRDEFTWAPELGLNLGYQCTDHIRVYVGYNFLYWSDVVRPGEQIDRTVNVNQLPPAIPGGPARPQFSFNGSDFWAQGVNVGIEFKY
jgi:hypothetical protein